MMMFCPLISGSGKGIRFQYMMGLADFVQHGHFEKPGTLVLSTVQVNA